MRITTAIKRLEQNYEKTKAADWVRKPIARALYLTWKWADTYEKERSNERR